MHGPGDHRVRRTLGDEQRNGLEQRDQGNHVCIIDADGFSGLLAHQPAACLELRSVGNPADDLLIVTTPWPVATGTDLLGGAARARAFPDHSAADRLTSMAPLDVGTAAHEKAVGELLECLNARGARGCRPGAGMPPFDVGWIDSTDPSGVSIAEIKSLTGADQTDQIRLGIGQVLQYCYLMRQIAKSQQKWVRPVLVLDIRPNDDRWSSIAESADILLTWDYSESPIAAALNQFLVDA